MDKEGWEIKTDIKMKSQNIPDKLAYSLNEVSRITQIDSKIIQAWEQEFYFLNAGQTSSGDKIFRKKDLEIILRLKELVENQGLTLAGAKRKIQEEFNLKRTAPARPDRLIKILYQVREQLKEIASTLEKE